MISYRKVIDDVLNGDQNIIDDILIRECVMPMVKGKKATSKKGFSKNIKTEMKHGKPQKQAEAIAYSEARRGKKGKY